MGEELDQEKVRRVLDRLSLVRAYINTRADYYDSMLYNMAVVAVSDPSVTMGITKGLVLYVSSAWLLNDPEVSTDAVLGGCLVHECEHPLRGMDRLETIGNKELANIAGDLAINDNLRDNKWALPSWVLYPDKLGLPPNLTLEEYADLLRNNKNGSADKAKEGTPKIGSGACGSGGGSAVDPNLEEELDAAHGKPQAEVECIRKQTLDDIEEAAGRDTIPGHLKQLIAFRNKKPDVNWKSLLRRVVNRSFQHVAGATDYSLRNPSIGCLLMGIYVAGTVGKKLNIAVCEDTSMSMGEHQLQEARAEAYHLMRQAGVEEILHVQADTEVNSAKKVSIKELPTVGYHGRGGTDFIPTFKYLNTVRPRPNLVVYFTDGDGPAPPTPPKGMQVIWCIVRSPYARRPAKWGHVVVCDKNQKLAAPYT